MSVWYSVKWLDPLFAAFDAAFPDRGKASDGRIGDRAHELEVSGHNPDDTIGVRAERSDADTRPEVRAGDVTSDLRDPRGTRTIDVVRAILATPADRDRLIYIICDGKIWRASNGWRQETYTGGDKHFGHAHFSGDPASDENGAPWQSVLSFRQEDGMDLNEIGGIVPGITNRQALKDIWVWSATVRGLAPAAPAARNDDRFPDPRPAELAAPVLSDEQLEALADKVAVRLSTLRFVAADGTG